MKVIVIITKEEMTKAVVNYLRDRLVERVGYEVQDVEVGFIITETDKNAEAQVTFTVAPEQKK